MDKKNILLAALAFTAGASVTHVFTHSMPKTAPQIQPTVVAEERVLPEKDVRVQAEKKTEKAPKKESEEKEDKQKDDEDDKDEDEQEELAGNYKDPATCVALTDADTYMGKHEDFMYMLPGQKDWVFRSRQDLQKDFEISDEDLSLYGRFVEALKAKGTDLVIGYIPPRAMIASEFLPHGSEIVDDYDPEIARQNYNALIEKMREKGVRIVGTPQPEIGATYFNHADQHWTTMGAQNMAAAIAQYVHTLPSAKDLPQQTFKTTIGEEIQYDGRFGEFIEEVCDFRPSPETDKKVKTERVGDVNENDLFGEEVAPKVVLIGTSNSRRDEFNSNFDGYLKEELSTDVYNAAISGGGMDDSLLAYLGSDMFKKNPPKLLIWELPGYYDLGGAGMEYALRQGIASASGDCDKPLATFASAPVTGKKVMLFENLDESNIAPEQAYIALKFDKSVAKDFSVSIKTSDKKNQNFKFTRRREGNSSAFYYLPKPGEKEDAVLTSVGLNVNKSIDGLNVEAKLCPVMPPTAVKE